jgi:chain length determinant protein EpsF
MNPKQLLLILRARYRISVAVLLITVVSVAIVSELTPRQYTAETSVMVDIRSPDPISTVLLPPTMNPGSVGTQIDIIKSDRVARKVVRMLRLADSPTVKQTWQDSTGGRGKLEEWMSARLQRGVSVNPSRDSNIINISFRGTDPAFVAAVANAFAQAYIEASVELKVEPAKQYADWFAEQAKVLRENVERAQARVSEFQQKVGIVATEESMDFELTKLNELSARLTTAQAETRDALSKQRSGGAGIDTLPEVMQNTLVGTLRGNVASLEIRLKEVAVNLGVKHPQYQRMESELAEMKRKLAAEESRVASSYSTTSAIGRAKEAELRAAIEAQKKKLLDMKNQRDEIAVLLRDVDTAKRAYEAVTNRFNQTTLESQANRTNVSVLNPAVEPTQPSFPKPLEQMLLMALALGAVLACAAAYGVELLDRRIRSPDDLAEMLQLPVLGVIESARGPLRLGLARRAAALIAR